MSTEIKDVIDKVGRDFEEFKKVNDQRLDEIEKRNGEAKSETLEKLEKVEKGMDAAIELKDRLEKIEARLDDPNIGGSGANEKKTINKEHVEKFVNWVRNPSGENKAALEDIEQKAVTVGTATAGGHAVPEDLSRMIASKWLDISPMRQIVGTDTTSTGDYKKLVDVLGTASGWAGETDTRSETGTPTIQQVAPTFGELYAVPKTSEWSLDDIFFNVENWLVDGVSREFAKQEGAAVVSGNGTSKPTGFLNGTPVTTGDEDSPARAFGTLQYVATGAAGAFAGDRLASPPATGYDVILTLIYTLKAQYRQNARFCMNKATLGTIRKFHDGDGNYFWQPGLAAGEPSSLVGFPVTEAEDMPAIGANSFSVAFGDFNAGYLLVDRVPMRITRDEVTSKGHVLFYVRLRVGGAVIDDDAIKLLKFAAS